MKKMIVMFTMCLMMMAMMTSCGSSHENTPRGVAEAAVKYLSKKDWKGYMDLTDANDKQKEVYVDLGTENGIAPGNTLYVYRIKTIAGKYAKEQLAKLKVKKVEGEEICFCKVTSHGKELMEALDAGDQLVIMTN